jgi:hypothetical protein
VLDRAFQLEAAAADVSQIIADDPHGCIVLNIRAGFRNLLLANKHASCQYQCLRPLA